MSNLLEKASIIHVPAGYNVGSINSVKPSESPFADLTFDRGTTATRVNKDSLVENVQILGSELVVNGDFATDSDWVVGNGWSIDQENGKASYDDTVNGFILTDDVLTIGKKYRVNLNLLDTGGNTIRLSVNSGTGGDFQDYTDGDGLFTKVITASTNYVRIGGGTSGVAFSITNVSVKEVTEDTDIPRIDYQGGVGHWLIEPETTNFSTYSSDFSQGRIFNSTAGDASLTNATLSTPTINSPDGTANATKITATNIGGTGPVNINYFNVDLDFTLNSTLSVFAKKDTKDILAFDFLGYPTMNGEIYFNLTNGTVGTSTATFENSSIEDYGDGWYRCSVTLEEQPVDRRGTVRIHVCNADGNIQCDRDGSSSLFIWGIQSEISSRAFPTSYIPTSGSTATRDAETAVDGGDETLFGQTEGVLYVEMAKFENDSSTGQVSISSDSRDNVVSFKAITSNRLQMQLRAGGSSIKTVTSSDNISDNTNFNKYAVSYKSGEIKVFANGSQIGSTGTETFSFSSNIIFLKLNSGNEGNDDFRGKMKCIALFKEALTDSELQCLTS